MSEFKDGGPAFPVILGQRQTSEYEFENDYSSSLTLRDYFAAKTLGGMLAHATRYRPRAGASEDWHIAIAEEAYELADAMLRARKPKE